MVLTCLFIAHALTAKQTDSAVIPIHHMRASKALAFVQPLSSSDPDRLVTLSADDARGVILASGSSNGIKDVRSCVGLIDIARRKVSLRVSVDSDVDKESYELSAKILNGQMWKTSDADTGTSIAVTPRINNDGTVTLLVDCGTASVSVNHVVFRLKPGKSSSVSIGSNASVASKPGENAGSRGKRSPYSTDPKITFRLDSVS